MSEVIRVLAVIAVIGYVIGRQLPGEPLRGKRVVLLPVVLAVAGAADLGAHGRHVRPADVVFLVLSGLIAVTVGLPAAPGRVRPAAFRTAAARPPTWRCWPAWPVSGGRGGGDGSP